MSSEHVQPAMIMESAPSNRALLVESVFVPPTKEPSSRSDPSGFRTPKYMSPSPFQLKS